ncbi:hypothetical protein, partial [Shigella dysenteriae]|uniref:hypothetical protein n=1 Tax=Shigella dysenteriae TaxID=622 RepID=UPI00253F8D86
QGHRALSEHKTLSVSWSHYPVSYPLIILNKNAIIEVMAFLKKLELSNLAYQRVVSHLPPP